ncbi:MAG: protein translocase subunit SecF [Candidatus Aenigmarchaeota archaeon]|nr:protein translocase subunit SecF [Candidatus Aenigmarchaeota archaeon]
MDWQNWRTLQKFLIFVPIALLLSSFGILYSQHSQTGDIFIKSIELKGGTTITLHSPSRFDIPAIEKSLASFGQVSVREIRGFAGFGVTIEAAANADTAAMLDKLAEGGIDTSGSTVESVGPALGQSFWYQAQTGIVAAFIAMAVIVFFIFRTYIPSIAVVVAAAADIAVTIAFMLLFQIELSLASLAALLTLIGYSVDTDILLTTRMLRGDGSLGERGSRALKTGLTMTLTSIGALTGLYLAAASAVTNQIAAVLIIGLVADMIFTWILNAAILRWYAARRGMA